MDRREFIQVLGTSVAASTLAAKNGMAATTSSSDIEDRVVVFVDLSGGNDGLAMLPPLSQYDELLSYRPNITLPKNQILPLDSKTGLHPAMPKLYSLFQAGNAAMIQAVSYPVPNMSHFRSSEIVWSGSGSSEYEQTGWLGRYLDSQHPEFPIGYPTNDHPDPLSVAFSSSPSLATQGINSNYSSMTRNPSRLEPFQEDSYSLYEPPAGRFGEELEFLRTQMGLTSEYNQAIFDRFNSVETELKEEGNFAKDLEQITRLIKSGSKTKCYVVSQGGYDTHGGQVIDGDPSLGTHPDLLAELDQGLGSFMEGLETENLQDRVILVISTEFGRRIMSNDSVGTDHGHGAPWIVLGSRVNGQILGDSNVLPPVVDKKTNVPMQHDYRDIYATILTDWLGVSSAMVGEMFTHQIQPLPLFDSTVSLLARQPERELEVIPQLNGGMLIRFNSKSATLAQMRVVDIRGSIQFRQSMQVQAGINEINLNSLQFSGGRALAAGRYFVQIHSSEFQLTHALNQP